jgi:Kef-type K+ transport system membrane component KefB
MRTDIIPLVMSLIIFFASFISRRFVLSVAIIGSVIGIIAGNVGLHSEEWMITLATFGGIILTFLAGPEVDINLMKNKFKERDRIGFFSFLYQVQYSKFTGIDMGGDVIPSFITQKWFIPLKEENTVDIVDLENGIRE